MNETATLFADGAAYERRTGRSSRLVGAGTEVLQRDGALWVEAGLKFVESRAIRIPVTDSGFDEFWENYTVPEEPAGVARKMSPPENERLKVRLREELPIAVNGNIRTRLLSMRERLRTKLILVGRSCRSSILQSSVRE